MEKHSHKFLMTLGLLGGSILTALAQPINYSDGFEGATLNPFWGSSTLGIGSITTASTAQAHGGSQSIQFNTPSPGGADSSAEIFHAFANPVYGQMSVWVYDTPELADLVFQIRNQASGASLEIVGFENPDAFYGFRSSSQTFGASTLQRTLGWHQFSIQSLESGLTLSVDGVGIYSGSALAFDFFQIQSYNQGGAGSPAYWDDFSGSFTHVPEPAAASLAFLALAAVVGWRSLGSGTRRPTSG